MKTRISRIYKIIACVLLLSGGVAGISYYLSMPRTHIYSFDEDRDTPFILDIFKNDWHWLVSEYSTDFSPEYMLHYHASSKAPEHVGNLIIKVLYIGNDFVGFTAYHKEKFYQCKVLFLAVRSEFRSKGYGKLLLKHAIDDLCSQGCTKIWLVTRTTNYPAMKVYRDSGFVETSRDNGFVYFEYKP